MFLDHFQVLYYARPPDSQHLFSEPGNTPLLGLLMSPSGLRAAFNKNFYHSTFLKNKLTEVFFANQDAEQVLGEKILIPTFHFWGFSVI